MIILNCISNDFFITTVKRVVFGELDAKQQFSRLIEYFIKKRSSDLANKFLEKAFQKLHEYQRPFIAQTLARLLKKDKQFDKADEWILKAIKIVDFYTFYDTRGQVFKAQLEEKAKADSNILECVIIARQAAENFQAAVSTFKKQRNTFQEALKNFDVTNDLFSATSMTPALYGEINVSIKILESLKKSLDSKLHGKFIASLTSVETVDLHQVLT